MSVVIRPISDGDIEPVLQLSIRAWEPVFHSFEQVLGSNIFLKLYPDWQVNQRDAVRAVCEDTVKHSVWVADVDGTVAGFVACELKAEEKIGEVYMLAVDPAYQRRGIGGELNDFALQVFKDKGMKLALVGTGGEPGHAPARRAYERAGYTALPLVNYYKDL
jgi:ribosomal protein S18 acetylase RimI-like enzyme